MIFLAALALNVFNPVKYSKPLISPFVATVKVIFSTFSKSAVFRILKMGQKSADRI